MYKDVIFKIVIALYLLAALLLVIVTPIYLTSVFGVSDVRHGVAYVRCGDPKDDIKPRAEVEMENQCHVKDVSLAGAALSLLLALALIIAAIVLGVCYCQKKGDWSKPAVIGVTAVFLIVITIIIVLFQFASHSHILQEHCLWKLESCHQKFPVLPVLPIYDVGDAVPILPNATNSSRLHSRRGSSGYSHPDFPGNLTGRSKSMCDPDHNFVTFVSFHLDPTVPHSVENCRTEFAAFELKLHSTYRGYIASLALVFIFLVISAFLLFIALCAGSGSKSGGIDEKSMILIENIPKHTKSKEVHEKFPNAKDVEIHRSSKTADVFFKTKKSAEEAFEESELVKISSNPMTLFWMRPNELYIENLPPYTSEKELFREFPDAKRVKFEFMGDKGDVLGVLNFKEEKDAETAYEKSPREKLAKQRLDNRFSKIFITEGDSDDDDSDKNSSSNSNSISKNSNEENEDEDQDDDPKKPPKVLKTTKLEPPNPKTPIPLKSIPSKQDLPGNEHVEDDALANKIWGEEIPRGFSNISNKWQTDVYVTNLPLGVTKEQLLQIFEGGKRAYINGPLAMIGFDTRKEAAHGFKQAAKKRVNGKRLQITAYKPANLLRKDSRMSHNSASSLNNPGKPEKNKVNQVKPK